MTSWFIKPLNVVISWFQAFAFTFNVYRYSEIMEQIPCPFRAGVIIGPRGQTIRDLCDSTGAKVFIRGGAVQAENPFDQQR